MKHVFHGLLTGFWLAVGLSAPVQAEPRVAVTIKPIHALVAGVMEGVGTPALLMEGMASPHNYQLRPSEAAMLARADLVIWVGPGVESTFPEIIGMLPSSTRVLELVGTNGLVSLPAREGGVWSAEGDSAPPEEDHHHLGLDPHIWLDPANAIVLSQLFVDELSLLDPANAETYRANGADQVARLRDLEAEIAAVLAPVQDVPFITFHDAYQYFEKAYDLSAVAAIAMSPDRPPGARTVMELRHALMEDEVRCVFAEPQFEPRLVQTLIEGTGAGQGTLDPLGEAVPAGPDAYEIMMRNLTRDALACLQGQEGEGGG